MTDLRPNGTAWSEYHVDDVSDKLSNKVCRMLYLKRQGKSVVDIDMVKMMEYFNEGRAILLRIIRWYESQLLSTKFNVIG